MMDFPFYAGGDQKRTLPKRFAGATRIANDWQARGKAYEPDKGLQHAVSVAHLLGKPLLVTGEPGVGKTELANSIAYQFDLGEPIKLECKSSTTANDLFYTYDTLGRYLSHQWQKPTTFEPVERIDPVNPLQYLHYQGLGEAIVRANPDAMQPYVPQDWLAGKQQGPSVVLIDEVDKAPRDFPNDILNEVENLYFHISELNNVKLPKAPLPADLKPFVLITSNSEKNLPEAFLRRCIFYHIPFPEEKLARIAQNHFPALESGPPLLADAVSFFSTLREADVAWEKVPSTAEFLDWLEILIRITEKAEGGGLDQSLATMGSKAEPCFGALAKSQTDMVHVTALFRDWTP